MNADTRLMSEEEQQALTLRNLERGRWNAEHTFNSNKGELVNAIREKEDAHIIRRREECVEYWKAQVEKFEGKIFLHCLETGLNQERAWN